MRGFPSVGDLPSSLNVTVISHSPSKREKAMAMGADRFVVSSDAEQMAAAAKSIKFIIDTVSAVHQVSTFLPLLETGGTLVLVGIPGEKMQIGAWSMSSSSGLSGVVLQWSCSGLATISKWFSSGRDRRSHNATTST